MRNNPFIPRSARVLEIRTEAADVITFTLAFVDKSWRREYAFEPGQYNMVSLPGIGEAPISLSSSPEKKDTFDHTIRIAGRVTTALSRLAVGDILGVRGPYGQPWPLDKVKGKDIVAIAGGTGCACVKPIVDLLVDHRLDFMSATVMYGAKNTQELLFAKLFDFWQRQGITVHLTVDHGRDLDWPFHVGVVTTLFDRLQSPTKSSVALIAGPEIMIRFCLLDLIKRGWRRENIYISLERRMDCALKMCGHCQIGPKYVCQDGPVFNYKEIEHLFGAVA